MGIELNHDENKRRIQPRANTESIIPHEVVNNVIKLLITYKEIKLSCFHLLYQIKFNKILDCTSMGIDGGLLGLLKAQSGFIEIEKRDKIFFAVLRTDGSSSPEIRNEKGQASKERRIQKRLKFFADSFDNHLWEGKEELIMRNYEIQLSAYELALKINPEATKQQVAAIQKALARRPNGVKLNQLNLIVAIDFKVFNIASNINALTNELTEVFFRVDRADAHPVIHDGFVTTYSDLSGKDDNCYGSLDPICIVNEAIKTGLYHKTMLLVRDAGQGGLKLNVWSTSIRSNFECDPSEERLLSLGILFFFALARSNYIEIFSLDTCKNDLRAKRKTNLYE